MISRRELMKWGGAALGALGLSQLPAIAQPDPKSGYVDSTLEQMRTDEAFRDQIVAGGYGQLSPVAKHNFIWPPNSQFLRKGSNEVCVPEFASCACVALFNMDGNFFDQVFMIKQGASDCGLMCGAASEVSIPVLTSEAFLIEVPQECFAQINWL